ncbi:sigma 54-interacting transcriptional regulator [Sandaracinus amylolyticus]|uniref:Response regulator of zinc sigma-54-dependent two-component system n=1 Tax=Sandaracinus amylolyticus TaxID=927083 RepID=A0A0F6W064_9BACT|nr:sigma 54-interacting transcriptional regulator [Sandaracinus amylolyticus]AKF04106.1 Response regulator of zinc sigma-54-dependent two-component system [Sandaracinus amylolyticus]
MSDGKTVPTRRTGVPVRAVRVTVVTGPDAGRACESHDEPITVGTADGNSLVLSDRAVSRYHLELRGRGDRILLTDLATTNGTSVGGALVEDASVALASGTTVRLGQTELRVDGGEVVLVDVPGNDGAAGIVGRTVVMRRLLDRIAGLATKDAPVLLLGESGTGKELLARALHEGIASEPGTRRDRPFVTVDCGAVPPSLFASELFGHERGAFTGADRAYPGALERADGGTLFLDEIGELPAELQASLLGVLERRRVRRVGGRDERAIDVRLVSATHRDLRADVNAGRFRLDLYYRIGVVTVRVPPLRERVEDVPLLVERFLRASGYEGEVSALFSPAVMRELRAHRWPGNVRELRNVVTAALAVGETPELVAGERSEEAAGSDDDVIGRVLGLPYKEARKRLVDAFEVRYVRALLEKTGGNVRAAAREGEMDRSYLNDLIKRHGIRE